MGNGTPVIETDVVAPEIKKSTTSIALRYSAEADVDLASCQTYSVDTEESYVSAGEMRLSIDSKIKRSESARDALVRPLNDHVKWINSIFKPSQEKWKLGMSILSRGRIAFEQKREEEARLERKRLAEIARKEQERLDRLAIERAQRAELRGDTQKAEEILASTPQVPIPTGPVYDVPKVQGIAKVTYWFAEVVDLPALVTAVASGEVPMDSVLPNDSWLGRTAKALQKNMKYPGVRVWSEEREKGTGR